MVTVAVGGRRAGVAWLGAAMAASGLDVPLEHLAIVAEQAEHLVNAKAPRPPQARRDWLAALWAKERAKELLR